jgi:hypothetical protein
MLRDPTQPVKFSSRSQCPTPTPPSPPTHGIPLEQQQAVVFAVAADLAQQPCLDSKVQLPEVLNWLRLVLEQACKDALAFRKQLDRLAANRTNSWQADVRNPLKCWNCNEEGHRQRDCPKPRRRTLPTTLRDRPAPSSTPPFIASPSPRRCTAHPRSGCCPRTIRSLLTPRILVTCSLTRARSRSFCSPPTALRGESVPGLPCQPARSSQPARATL